MIISKLKILDSVPFNAEDNTVITFDNAQEQYEFFDDHTYLYFENVMYVKGFLYKKIKLDVAIDQISYCNYVMFINKEFDSTKWIYAYIKNFEYVSDACTYIEIEIDYIQTFMAEIVFETSYIDRQMPYNDDISTREMFIDDDEVTPSTYIVTNEDDFINADWKVCVCYKPNLILENAKDLISILSSQLSGGTDYTYRDFLDATKEYNQYFNKGGAVFDKYITGCAFRIYNISNQNDIDTIVKDVWKIEIFGYSILNIYMIPKNLNGLFESKEVTLNATKNPYYTNKKIPVYSEPYTPINNKCFTSPYIYLECSNLQSNIKKYNYQCFLKTPTSNPNFKFKILQSILNRYDAVIFPMEYKNIKWNVGGIDTYDYGVDIGETAECQWNSSMSNAVKQVAKVTADVAVATAGAEIASQAPKVAKSTLEQAELARKSQAIGGAINSAVNNTDLSTKGVSGMPILQTIFNYVGWVFKQYACVNIEEIDNYFSMYGYKISEYNIPNILGNKRFNYVRIGNPRIFGTIPLYAKNAIKEKLKNGVTFWHDKNNFSYGNFRNEYSNEIINKRLNNGKIFRNII